MVNYEIEIKYPSASSSLVVLKGICFIFVGKLSYRYGTVRSTNLFFPADDEICKKTKSLQFQSMSAKKKTKEKENL